MSQKYKIDIAALTETKNKGAGTENISKGYEIAENISKPVQGQVEKEWGIKEYQTSIKKIRGSADPADSTLRGSDFWKADEPKSQDSQS